MRVVGEARARVYGCGTAQLGSGRHMHANVGGMISPTPDPTSQATIAAIEAVGIAQRIEANIYDDKIEILIRYTC